MTTTDVQPVATYANADDGIEARVVRFPDGRFSITLYDVGANLPVGTRIYPADREGDALAYAASLV